jgi:ferredoxin
MILYFSATGNGLYMAQEIGAILGDEVVNVPELLQSVEIRQDFQRKIEKAPVPRLGIVFPVYAWDAPELVYRLIDQLNLSADIYVYGVALCGENVGHTFKHLSKRLKDRGLHLSAAYSVVSPNNYIVVGKSDIESPVLMEQLLEVMGLHVDRIAKAVKSQRIDQSQVVEGPVPWLTTGAINKLFNRFGRSDKAFYAQASCTHCGLCEKVCPVENILIDKTSELPVWQGHCTMCLACLHTCPVQAIQYGKATVKKGRYFNPLLERDSITYR